MSFGLDWKVNFLCIECPMLWKKLSSGWCCWQKGWELVWNLPRAWESSRRRRSLALSFVWTLPSRCERVGLGAPGWGNNYPEHSCDLLGLVNIPEPTPLNFCKPTWSACRCPDGCVWKVAPSEERLRSADSSRLSGKLVDPQRLASVCPRNWPTNLEDVCEVLTQSLTCCLPSSRECICGASKSNIWRRRKAASPYLTSSGGTFMCHTHAVKNGGWQLIVCRASQWARLGHYK